MSPPRRLSPVEIALYSVPSIAVLSAAATMLIGASPRVLGARIHGGPPAADGTLALRFSVLEYDQSIFVPQSHLNLALQIKRGPGSVVIGQTDSDGAWETRIPLGSSLAPTLSLELLANGIERVIPHAEIPISPPSFALSQHLISPELPGSNSGDFKFSVKLARATMAAPFDETLIVRATQSSGLPASNAKVNIDGEVLFSGNQDDLHLDNDGAVRLVMRPINHAARLEILARIPGNPELEGSWKTVLPVQPGAMWLDPKALLQQKISVFSPVRHRAAYLTIFNQNCRFFSTRLELLPDQEGGSQGSMPLPPAIPDPAWLLVSPDPPGQGQEKDTVAWPLSTKEVASASSLQTPLLFDGMPAALARSRSRSILARRVSTLVLALAAFLESGLLLVRARRAKRELDEVLSSDADLDHALINVITGGHRFWLRLVGASLVVALALSTLAVMAWMGGTP